MLSNARRFGPLLVAAWGWSMLAVAGAQSVGGVVAAGLGLLAALLQLRFTAATAAVELAALSYLVVTGSEERLIYIGLGALLAVAARAAAAAFKLPEDT